MNTSEVAKLLGVSASTIQRWVKQLELPMERNERGHYFFKEEDIESLKAIQSQIQHGVLLQEIAASQEKTQRKGTVKAVENDQFFETLAEKISKLESRLDDKADSVATYQLLQHRSEIEELQDQVKELTNRIETLEEQIKNSTSVYESLMNEQTNKKRKRKNFVRSLFGF